MTTSRQNLSHDQMGRTYQLPEELERQVGGYLEEKDQNTIDLLNKSRYNNSRPVSVRMTNVQYKQWLLTRKIKNFERIQLRLDIMEASLRASAFIEKFIENNDKKANEFEHLALGVDRAILKMFVFSENITPEKIEQEKNILRDKIDLAQNSEYYTNQLEDAEMLFQD